MSNAKTVKAPNYTPEVEAKIVADYAAGVTIAAIAESVGKAQKSVIAKLSRLGVYKKAEKVSKVTGTTPATKEKMVEQIAAKVGVPADTLQSLTAATKTALALVLENLPDAPAAE